MTENLDRKIAFSVAAATSLFAAFMAGYAVGQDTTPQQPATNALIVPQESPPLLPVEDNGAGNATVALEEPCTPWNPDSPRSAPANPC